MHTRAKFDACSPQQGLVKIMMSGAGIGSQGEVKCSPIQASS